MSDYSINALIVKVGMCTYIWYRVLTALSLNQMVGETLLCSWTRLPWVLEMFVNKISMNSCLISAYAVLAARDRNKKLINIDLLRPGSKQVQKPRSMQLLLRRPVCHMAFFIYISSWGLIILRWVFIENTPSWQNHFPTGSDVKFYTHDLKWKVSLF